MSKFFQALLSGLFFTYFIDFFFFLGLKKNYIDPLQIDIYYNIFFADNQNVWVYLLLSIFIGYIVIYINITFIKVFILSILFVLGISTNIPQIGHKVGMMLFQKKNVTFKNKRYTFIGDVLYNGRKNITFYDYELQKQIQLKKKELIQ
ncbi:hypothetical protein MNB_SM-3-100 [hydrothermal vent metagenome]|uniref:Uncharacterized protein n=1 Tax=hydrothermal vent metagenome TaxID=652676 RepID=A0A1W1D3J2_9ZZZZ